MRRLIVMLAAAPTLALAAIPDSSGMYTACLQKQKGSLRVVDAAEVCEASETRVTWNARGAPGESVAMRQLAVGDATCRYGGTLFAVGGATAAVCNGAPGAPGATGAPGPQGAKGDPGEPVLASQLSVGDANCPYGGTQFTSFSGVTFACNGATGASGGGKPIVWSGGCTRAASGTSNATFVRFCADGLDFSTAQAHLDVASTGVVTVKVAGLYRIRFRPLAQSCSSLVAAILRNGADADVAFGSVASGSWTLAQDVVLPFAVGDRLEVGVRASCTTGKAYREWTAGAPYSRLQIEYLGAM